MYYHLTTDGLVRFRYKIYVSNDSELEKFILRDFNVNPYSSHLGYHNMFMVVTKFYYWLNLKKKVA